MSPVSKEDALLVKSIATEQARLLVPIASTGLTKIGASYAVKINLVEEPRDQTALPNSIKGVRIVYEVVGMTGKSSVASTSVDGVDSTTS